MPVRTEPLRKATQCSAEAIVGRFPLHHPVALPGPAPEVRETQEIEGFRALTTTTPRWRLRARLLESQQPGFLRMESQPVLLESLRKYFSDSARVCLCLEDHHEVVRVSDE